MHIDTGTGTDSGIYIPVYTYIYRYMRICIRYIHICIPVSIHRREQRREPFKALHVPPNTKTLTRPLAVAVLQETSTPIPTSRRAAMEVAFTTILGVIEHAPRYPWFLRYLTGLGWFGTAAPSTHIPSPARRSTAVEF